MPPNDEKQRYNRATITKPKTDFRIRYGRNTDGKFDPFNSHTFGETFIPLFDHVNPDDILTYPTTWLVSFHVLARSRRNRRGIGGERTFIDQTDPGRVLYVSRGRRKVEWNRDCSCERARKERESWEAEVGTGAREDEEEPVHGRSVVGYVRTRD